MPTCSRQECTQPVSVRGLCRQHYWQNRRDRLSSTTCSVAGCTRPEFCRKLCRGHYARDRRGAPVNTPLSNRRDGNVTMTLRISHRAAVTLSLHATAAGVTPNQLAVRLLLRELGLTE